MSDTGELEALRDELVAALSRLTAVRSIDTFGSLARGTADRWSDIDLLVWCEAPELTAWRAAGAIRVTKPVSFYRMFTGVAQPSGRYWFHSASPFHRLDVSFAAPEERAPIVANGVRAGHPVQLHTEYVARGAVDLDVDARAFTPAAPCAITEHETELGRLLYVHLLAAKDHFRGGRADMKDTRNALEKALADGPIVAGGGDLLAFIAQVDRSVGRCVRVRR